MCERTEEERRADRSSASDLASGAEGGANLAGELAPLLHSTGSTDKRGKRSPLLDGTLRGRYRAARGVVANSRPSSPLGQAASTHPVLNKEVCGSGHGVVRRQIVAKRTRPASGTTGVLRERREKRGHESRAEPRTQRWPSREDEVVFGKQVGDSGERRPVAARGMSGSARRKGRARPNAEMSRTERRCRRAQTAAGR